ncbi:MAG: hypothetical protein DWI21_08600 [Planctomycetota bacterium]|nr:MAG: hypothetical protein DWI21_08600 [Planctomycetota bacterium]
MTQRGQSEKRRFANSFDSEESSTQRLCSNGEQVEKLNCGFRHSGKLRAQLPMPSSPEDGLL